MSDIDNIEQINLKTEDDVYEDIVDAFDAAVTHYNNDRDMAKDITDIFDIFMAYCASDKGDKTMLNECKNKLKNLSVFAEEDDIVYFDDIINSLKMLD